jgi:hypothetical protein
MVPGPGTAGVRGQSPGLLRAHARLSPPSPGREPGVDHRLGGMERVGLGPEPRGPPVILWPCAAGKPRETAGAPRRIGRGGRPQAAGCAGRLLEVVNSLGEAAANSDILAVRQGARDQPADPPAGPWLCPRVCRHRARLPRVKSVRWASETVENALESAPDFFEQRPSRGSEALMNSRTNARHPVSPFRLAKPACCMRISRESAHSHAHWVSPGPGDSPDATRSRTGDPCRNHGSRLQ